MKTIHNPSHEHALHFIHIPVNFFVKNNKEWFQISILRKYKNSMKVRYRYDMNNLQDIKVSYSNPMLLFLHCAEIRFF